jgi:hypothetical protein
VFEGVDFAAAQDLANNALAYRQYGDFAGLRAWLGEPDTPEGNASAMEYYAEYGDPAEETP